MLNQQAPQVNQATESNMDATLEKILSAINSIKNAGNNSASNSNNRNSNANSNSLGNNKRRTPGKMAWRKVAPQDGEPNTKMFEEVEYKWCGKCRDRKGLWTKGEGKHGTNEHDPTKRRHE